MLHHAVDLNVQHGDDGSQAGLLDNAHRGKALNYGHLMLEANPDREMAVVVVTNTVAVQVFQLKRVRQETPGRAPNDKVEEAVSSAMLMLGDGKGMCVMSVC